MRGVSNDFPFVVYNHGGLAFLVPSSIMCSCWQMKLTKSERNKREADKLREGQCVDILVHPDANDYTVKVQNRQILLLKFKNYFCLRHTDRRWKVSI